MDTYPQTGNEPETLSMDLAVIVPCHNAAGTLAFQLEALTRQSWNGTWRIIIVDNRSTDATRQIAMEYAQTCHRIQIVTASDGTGVSYARNSGVRAAHAVNVAFCDGDDIVGPGWVSAIGDALRSHRLVTGTLDLVSLNSPELALSRGRGDPRAVPRFGQIPFARGNNCGMTVDLWRELDGYDESFVGLEDIELSLRAAASGTSVHLVETATIAYRYRDGYRALFRQGLFYGRGTPELARRALQLGLTPPGRLAGLRSWAWLVVELPRLRTRSGRLSWLWVLANRIGVFTGALRAGRFRV